MMSQHKKWVIGRDRKALVSCTVTSGIYDSHACTAHAQRMHSACTAHAQRMHSACTAHALQPTRVKPSTIYRQRACLLLNTCSALESHTRATLT